MDVHKRLRGIKDALESKADLPEDVDEKLRLLDNLIEIVENIDYARGKAPVRAAVRFGNVYTSGNVSVARFTADTWQDLALSVLSQSLHGQSIPIARLTQQLL